MNRQAKSCSLFIESNDSIVNMSELNKQKIIEKLRESMEVSSTLFTSGQVMMQLILFYDNEASLLNLLFVKHEVLVW